MANPERVIRAYWELVRRVHNKRLEALSRALNLTNLPNVYTKICGYGGYNYFDPEGVAKDPPTLSEVIKVDPLEKVQKFAQAVDVDVSWVADMAEALSEWLSSWGRIEVRTYHVLTPMWVRIGEEVYPLEHQKPYYVAVGPGGEYYNIFIEVDLSQPFNFMNKVLSEPVSANCPCGSGCTYASGSLRLNDCPILINVLEALNALKEGVVVRALGNFTVYVMDTHVSVEQGNYYLIKADRITDVTKAVKTVLETDLQQAYQWCRYNTVSSLCFDVCGGNVLWSQYSSICTAR
mgnify:CR=1 FL=1